MPQHRCGFVPSRPKTKNCCLTSTPAHAKRSLNRRTGTRSRKEFSCAGNWICSGRITNIVSPKRITTSFFSPGGQPGGSGSHASKTRYVYLDIAILPAYQNRRIGTHLLHTLIAESEKVGKPLRHWIYKLNTEARRFYERLGFRLIEDDRAYLFMERPPGGAHASEPSHKVSEVRRLKTAS